MKTSDLVIGEYYAERRDKYHTNHHKPHSRLLVLAVKQPRRSYGYRSMTDGVHVAVERQVNKGSWHPAILRPADIEGPYTELREAQVRAAKAYGEARSMAIDDEAQRRVRMTKALKALNIDGQHMQNARSVLISLEDLEYMVTP